MLDLIAYKNTHVPIKNLIENSDFSSGLESWATRTFEKVSLKKNLLAFKFNGASGYVGVLDTAVNGEDRYYIATSIKTDNPDLRFKVSGTRSIYHSGNNQWETLSSVVSYEAGSINFHVQDVVSDNQDSTNYISGMVFINLTETFGKGNEPTKEQMDKLLKTRFENGLFDGTKNLFNARDFMNLYHKKMTELDNAITALGGGS